MRVEDYAKYINVLHDLALVEDDLRHEALRHSMGANDWDDGRIDFARRLLFERFGVDL